MLGSQLDLLHTSLDQTVEATEMKFSLPCLVHILSILLSNQFFIALGGLHYFVFNPLIESVQKRTLERSADWKQTTVQGAPFVVHPQEKIQLKFLA